MFSIAIDGTVFKQMCQPQPLFRLFSVFSNKQYNFTTNFYNNIFTTNQCEKISCLSSVRHQDLNPQPLECMSSPITTRPWLLPLIEQFEGLLNLSNLIMER